MLIKQPFLIKISNKKTARIAIFASFKAYSFFVQSNHSHVFRRTYPQPPQFSNAYDHPGCCNDPFLPHPGKHVVVTKEFSAYDTRDLPQYICSNDFGIWRLSGLAGIC